MDLLPPSHATHHPTRHWADDSDELRRKNLPVSNDYLLALATLSSLLSVLFYQTTSSEFFQKVSIKQPGTSQKKLIILFYFRAAMANFLSLLNNLVWIFGKSLY